MQFFIKCTEFSIKKSANFMSFNYLWSKNSVFAKCDFESNKILKLVC